MGTDAPGWWRKLRSGNQTEMYEQAVEDVTIKVQQKVKKMKKDAKASGKDIVVGNRLYKKIIKETLENHDQPRRYFVLDDHRAEYIARYK